MIIICFAYRNCFIFCLKRLNCARNPKAAFSEVQVVQLLTAVRGFILPACLAYARSDLFKKPEIRSRSLPQHNPMPRQSSA
ncbi:hypothetical protein L596_023949 [Steinernema carpocapsae]|uniref:Uncharacterized protein n=1 Tax=Steinernema carpocapsae TaxID=34508 RepID=A0A4V6XVU9_STECR|nr:hypothetical protein L596_023949 [Steinernema carpocapsae]